MKKIALVIALAFSVCAFAQIENVIPKKPNPQRLVNDFADVLTPDQEEALEKKLEAYDDSTSSQIAVVTITTLQDYEVSEVALGILRNWGIGGAKNNGLVILAAIKEHKIWISTGYGMEGVVPDITAKSIVENDITPNFRDGNYYRGFDEAVNAIFKSAVGEYKVPDGYRNKGKGGINIGKIIIGIVVLIFILSMFGGGSGGGGYVSRRGSSWLAPFILGNLLGRGSGGFGGGGFGGGGWGGSGGGGGFGGFGGGSGGGGGAGGSW